MNACARSLQAPAGMFVPALLFMCAKRQSTAEYACNFYSHGLLLSWLTVGKKNLQMDLQSLQDALQGELKGSSSKADLEKIPTNSREFFPIVLSYCQQSVPQITINRKNRFKFAVFECFKHHYKVTY